MALGTSNISVSLLKSTLSSSSNNVSALCTSNNINMWSRFKPVSGNWPTANDGDYGFEFPVSTSGGAWTQSNWTYTKPTSNFRKGDFRGYEHSPLFPPVYSLAYDNRHNEPTLYPDGAIYANGWSIKGNSTNNTTRVKMSELSSGAYSGYYVGIRLKVGSNFYSYKTVAPLSSISETTGTYIEYNCQVSVNEGAATFADAPDTTVGTASWELILCSSSVPNWTTTPPTTCILLPNCVVNGQTVENSGSFTVSGWIVLSDLSMSWGNSDLTYQNSFVYTSGTSWTYGTLPNWINANVYRGSSLTNAPYISGDELRLSPDSVNTGGNRSGQVVIGTKVIDVWQDGHNPALLGYDLTGLTISGGTATLIVNSTTCQVGWTTLTGYPSRTTYWVRLFCNTTSTYLGNWQSGTTINNEIESVSLTGLGSTDIEYGKDYTVYVTNINPLI